MTMSGLLNMFINSHKYLDQRYLKCHYSCRSGCIPSVRKAAFDRSLVKGFKNIPCLVLAVPLSSLYDLFRGAYPSNCAGRSVLYLLVT